MAFLWTSLDILGSNLYRECRARRYAQLTGLMEARAMRDTLDQLAGFIAANDDVTAAMRDVEHEIRRIGVIMTIPTNRDTSSVGENARRFVRAVYAEVPEDLIAKVRAAVRDITDTANAYLC